MLFLNDTIPDNIGTIPVIFGLIIYQNGVILYPVGSYGVNNETSLSRNETISVNPGNILVMNATIVVKNGSKLNKRVSIPDKFGLGLIQLPIIL